LLTHSINFGSIAQQGRQKSDVRITQSCERISEHNRRLGRFLLTDRPIPLIQEGKNMFTKTTLALACALAVVTATAASAQYRSYGYSEPSYGYRMESQAYRYRSAPPEYGYRNEPIEYGYYTEAPRYEYWQGRRLINRNTGEQ
jgi:hypothetical protein